MSDKPDLWESLGQTLGDGINNILGAGLDSVAESISPDYAPGSLPHVNQAQDSNGANLTQPVQPVAVPGFSLSPAVMVGGALALAAVVVLLVRK